jgi:hypothetical protein
VRALSFCSERVINKSVFNKGLIIRIKVKLREEEDFTRTNATDSSLFPAKVPSIAQSHN